MKHRKLLKKMANIHVVIPCYNVEKYLEQAVQSVLDQPCKDIDIVLVDDGSPGETPALCDAIAARESRIHVIHKPNGGVSSARNAGIEFVLDRYADDLTGRYIAFLDGDDCWNYDFWSGEVYHLLHQSYDILGFEHCECNADMALIKHIANNDAAHVKNGGTNSLWAHGKRHLGCMFFSAFFLRQYDIRFPDGLAYNEDEIFKLYAECLCDKMYFGNRPMYKYRLHNASVVHNLDRDIPLRYRIWMDAWQKFDMTLAEKYGIFTQFGTKYAAYYLIEMCVVYVESLVSFSQFSTLWSTYKNGSLLSHIHIDDCPQHLRKEFLLLTKSAYIFYTKHFFIGLLRKAKQHILLIPILRK